MRIDTGFWGTGLLLSVIILGNPTLGLPQAVKCDPPPPHAQILTEVYDSLWVSLGIGPALSKPPLCYRGGITMGIFYDGHQITVDAALFRVLERRLSGPQLKAALGILIGHELGHFVQGQACHAPHPIPINFEPVSSLENIPHDPELAADYFGIFLAHLSEFQVGEVLAETFMALSQIAPPDKDHPATTDRIQQARHSWEQIDQLSSWYEIGHIYFAIQAFDKAAACFEHLATYFPSREVWNQAGLSQMQLALKLGGTNKFRWGYPIEADADTRLFLDVRDPADMAAVKIQHALSLAEQFFYQAAEQTPAYAPSWLHLAGIHLLNQAYSKAFDALQKSGFSPAERAFHDPFWTKAFLLYSLISLESHQMFPNKFQQNLLAIMRNASSPDMRKLAEQNLHILHRSTPKSDAPLDPYVANIPLPPPIETSQSFIPGQDANWGRNGIWAQLKWDNLTISYFPREVETQQIPALPLGAMHRDAVLETFGTHPFRTPLKNGMVSYYPFAGCLIWFDHQGHIRRWALIEK